MKFLHLNDNEVYIPKGQPGHDPIFKLRPFLTSFVNNCQNSFQLGKELSIDESMISFKGRLIFKQYAPKKPTKWGMKAFVLADSQTGYVYNWRLYTGKYMVCYLDVYVTKTLPLTGKDYALDRDGRGLAHAVVLKLLERIEGKGHHVYMDNWYIFEDLHRRGFDATGTVRTDRRGMPPAMKATIKKNDMIESHFGSLMAIKWMAKRAVCVLTTTDDKRYL